MNITIKAKSTERIEELLSMLNWRSLFYEKKKKNGVKKVENTFLPLFLINWQNS